MAHSVHSFQCPRKSSNRLSYRRERDSTLFYRALVSPGKSDGRRYFSASSALPVTKAHHRLVVVGLSVAGGSTAGHAVATDREPAIKPGILPHGTTTYPRRCFTSASRSPCWHASRLRCRTRFPAVRHPQSQSGAPFLDYRPRAEQRGPHGNVVISRHGSVWHSPFQIQDHPDPRLSEEHEGYLP